MDLYMLVLRIVHILAGAFWVGSALTVFLFLQPAAREVGPAAGPFMTHLAQKKRLPDIVLGAAGLTILAGLLMYWRVSGGFDPDWIGSTYGLTITVGAVSAIVAVALGASVVRPSMVRAGQIAQSAAAAGGPTPEQAAELQMLQAKVRTTGAWIVPLLLLAAAAMAGAQYL
ncbi:MAG TPA: hypothetical protein VF108_00900 [Actinomycetota bacterium]